MIIFIKIAVIATVIAVATTENACTTLRAPTDLRIVLVENFLTITWAISTDVCADHYEVRVEMNCIESYITTQVPFYFFEHTANCTVVNISVARIVKDGRRSAPASLTYTRRISPGFGTVTNLTLTPTDGAVMVRWVGPAGFRQCAMTYKVTVGDKASLVEKQELEVTLENLEYCTTTTISVVPVIDGIEGAQLEEDTSVNVPQEFGAVSDLNAGSRDDDDNVLVTWSRPEGFDSCTITYQVTVDGETILVDGLQHPVSLGDMSYCESKTVHVLPMVGPIEGISKLVDAVVQVSPGFAQVLQLAVNYAENQVALVTWSPPAGFEECTIKYQVTVDDGEPILIDVVEYQVSLAGMLDCEKKTVNVLPVVGPIEGLSKSVDAVVQVSAGFAPVLDLAVNYPENQDALVTWSRPVGFEECTMKYQVTVDDGEPILIDVVEYQVSLAGMLDCEKKTVNVLPVVGPIEGLSKSVDAVVQVPAGFAPVLDLAVNYPENYDVLVTWSPPAGFEECTIKYQVTVDDGEPILIDVVEYQVSLAGMLDCEKKTVNVLPVVGPIEGLSKSVDAVVQVPAGFAPVLDLAVNYPEDQVAFVTWSRLAGFEECTIKYQVTVDDGEPILIDVVEYQVSLAGMLDCEKKTVNVLPVVGTIEGLSKSVDAVVQVPAGFAPVLDLAVNYPEDQVAFVTWSRLAGFEECTIKYQVTVDDGEPILIDVVEYQVSLAGMLDCEKKTVNVLPVVGPIEGLSKSVDAVVQVSAGFAPVLDLAVNYPENQDALVTWSRPVGFEECTMKYQVTVDDGEPILIDVVEYQVSLAGMLDCGKKTVNVLPVVGPIEGLSKSVDAVVQVPAGFAPVLDLAVNYPENYDVLVTWSPPAGFEECTIKYQVTVDDGEPILIDVVEYQVSLAGMLDCEKKTVNVLPVVGTIEGLSKSVDAVVQVPAGFAPVLDLAVNYPEDEVAFVTWSRPPGFDECAILYRVTIDDESTVIAVLQYTVLLVDFLECESVQVLPVVGSIEGESRSVDAVRLSPGFAPVLDLAVEYPDNNNALVTWTRPDGFVGCTIQYRVTFDGESSVIDATEFTVSLAAFAECESRTIDVLTVVGSIEHTSKSVDVVRLPTGLATVLDLAVDYPDNNNALVTWTRPDGFVGCTIQYRVTFDGESSVIDATEFTVSLEDFAECESRTVDVLTVVSPIEGTLKSVDVIRLSTALAPVLDLAVEYPDNYNGLVTWTRPDGLVGCTIFYLVTFDGNRIKTDMTEFLVSLVQIGECKSRTVNVQPVVGPIEGTLKSVDAVRPPTGLAPVLDLAVEYPDNNNALVTWTRPDDFVVCTIQYRVTFDGESCLIDATEFTASLEDFAECESRTVDVLTVVGPIEGPLKSVDVVRLPTGLAPVLDLAVKYPDNNNALVTWSRPDGFVGCTIQYRVTFHAEPPVVIDATQFPISLGDFTECESRTGYVQAVVGPIVGTSLAAVVVAHNPETCPENSSD